MGCVFSEVATWISEGKFKLFEYRRRRKQEILEKSSQTASEDCFHYRSEALETVAQIHTEIMETSRMNDYITPNVIRKLVNGMIRPNPHSRGPAQYHHETSVEILREAKVELKRTLPHTVSDPFVDVRMPRQPPNFPPGRGQQVPARRFDIGDNVPPPLQTAELHNSPSRPVGQDRNRLQQGRAVRSLEEHGDQQGGESFGVHSEYFPAQTEEPRTHGPSKRIVSHPAASSVQSQQYARSFTSTAGIAGPFPNSRPLGALADGSDATDTSILPQRPRDSRAINNDLLNSRVELNGETSDFASSERADLASRNHTFSQAYQPTASDTYTQSSVGQQSAPHQRPHPKMSVEEGLRIKKAKRSNSVMYPGEEDFHTSDDILKKRDHVRELTVCYLSGKLTISLGFPHR